MDAASIIIALLGGGGLAGLVVAWTRHRSSSRGDDRADAASLVTYVADDAARDRAERDTARAEVAKWSGFYGLTVMPYIHRLRWHIRELGGDPEEPPEGP